MNEDRLASIANRVAEEALREELGLDSEADDDVVQFILDHPFPSEEAMHAFAEETEFGVKEAEVAAYRLATFFAQFLRGGRANEEGFDKGDADPNELAMGIEIELEHTPNRLVAERIALDHLAELKDYYTRLKKMEAEAGIKE